jgi:hypothetical protein
MNFRKKSTNFSTKRSTNRWWLSPRLTEPLLLEQAPTRGFIFEKQRVLGLSQSHPAEAILSQMLEQLNRAGDESFFQHLDTKGAAIDAAIAKLKEAARRDLNR